MRLCSAVYSIDPVCCCPFFMHYYHMQIDPWLCILIGNSLWLLFDPVTLTVYVTTMQSSWLNSLFGAKCIPYALVYAPFIIHRLPYGKVCFYGNRYQWREWYIFTFSVERSVTFVVFNDTIMHSDSNSLKQRHSRHLLTVVGLSWMFQFILKKAGETPWHLEKQMRLLLQNHPESMFPLICLKSF